MEACSMDVGFIKLLQVQVTLDRLKNHIVIVSLIDENMLIVGFSFEKIARADMVVLFSL